MNNGKMQGEVRYAKCLLCGNYGAGNIGDEAVLEGILNDLKSDYDITVISADPEETAKKFEVKTVERWPTGIRSWLRSRCTKNGREAYQKTQKAFKDCDIFVLGGGTLLTDEPRRSMVIWGKHLEQAYSAGKTVWIYKSGIGPFYSKKAQEWARSLLKKASKISVRDRKSEAWGKELLGEKITIQVEKDPAFELSFKKPSNPKKREPNTIIFVPRFWTKNENKWIGEVSQFIRFLCLEKGKKVIGIPFEKMGGKDLAILNKIFEQARVWEHAEIEENYTSPQDIIEAMKGAEMVIGMRLHSLIFAELAQVPFIGLAYMEKVSALGEELNKKQSVLPLENINFNLLKKAYDKVSQCRGEQTPDTNKVSVLA